MRVLVVEDEVRLAATLQEPGGRIDIEADWKDGEIISLTIGGPVRLGAETLVDTDQGK